MQLAFDADVEAFRAEFVAFLDEHLPDEAETVQRSRSSSDIPAWARRWQRLLFDHGWLLPGNPPEFGGRNATVLQQYVHAEELSRRRIYHKFQSAGCRHHRGVDPVVRDCGAEAELGGADPAGRDDGVARHERTGRRLGSGVAAHPCSARRRRTSWSTGKRCGRRAPTTPTCC